MHYAQVLLPLQLEKTLTYTLPQDVISGENIGKRVVVEVRNKLYTGVIVSEDQTPVDTYAPKPIIEILDTFALVSQQQIKLWSWIASYYCCTVGEVMRTALPSSLKIQSETKIELSDAYTQEAELTDDQSALCAALSENKTLTVNDVVILLGKKQVLPLLRDMASKGLINIFEQYNEKYRPLLESFVYLSVAENEIEQVFELTKRSEKQRLMLMSFLSLRASNEGVVSKKQLLSHSSESAATLDALVKKGILSVLRQPVDRIKGDSKDSPIKDLSTAQKRAFDQIITSFESKKTALLHGVTGSGKTEIYVQLIRKAIERGQQVLYLLPEISLTTQLVGRLKRYFGEKIGVYHTKYGDMQRTEVFQRVRSDSSNKFDIILGTRNAVFLPFSNLGLVIVDEEHESGYKQQDPAPRYNARDTAMVLASIHGADIVLGSATPSVESYHNALSGKYSLVELSERYRGVKIPPVHVVNIKEAYTAGAMTGHFSTTLIQKINSTIEQGKQVILFQNRRGYSPMLLCRSCGWTPQCKNCDVSLTYHKHSQSLRCHYCGYSISVPMVCAKCGSPSLDTKGLGTEQLEIETKKLFPDARVLRMDMDTTTGKNSYQNIITQFENGEADILIGTAMLAKGLDFDNVEIVGILNADNTFKLPDFRSFERSFQLLCQVGGRAGRKSDGEVFLQTYEPLHTVVRNVFLGDYKKMYEQIIEHRREFFYPPFCRMVKVQFKAKNPQLLDQASALFASVLRGSYGENVLGPDYHYIPRINNMFIKHLYLKIPNDLSLSSVKAHLKKINTAMASQAAFRSVRVAIDVDPM